MGATEGYGSLSSSAPQLLSSSSTAAPSAPSAPSAQKLRAWGLGCGVLSALVLSAHCLVGFVVYGPLSSSAGSAPAALLTTPGLVAEGVERRWESLVEPSGPQHPQPNSAQSARRSLPPQLLSSSAPQLLLSP